MKKANTLVINLSLRSIRTIIFDDQGKKIFEDWLPVRTYINGLSVEQDGVEWWSLLKELLHDLGKKSDLVENIASLTVTSSALCLVPVDKKGNPVEKVMMVSDKRAIEESEDLKEKFHEFFANKKEFKADASYMLPKILWFKKHKQKIFKKAVKFLSANDFLLLHLTGEYVTDTFNAEKFYFVKSDKSYPKKILSHIGLQSSQLPRVVEAGTVVGPVLPEIRKEFPFLKSVKVVVGTYDAICALIGSSTHEPGELNNVCGTCSSYRFLTTNSKQVVPGLLEQEFVSEKLRIIGGSNNLEGGVLEWAKECFYREGSPTDDATLYKLMVQEATESSLGANGLLFVPYLIGERLPISDAYVRGMFFGLERFHSRKDIMRSIFEATAFQAKLMIDEFEKSGIEVSVVNMSGGVAKLPLAAQIRSDVLGIPVSVLQEVETTAVGAYILIQKALKNYTSIREGKKLVHVEKKYIPNMHNHNCYASLFMLYKELYVTNASLFKRRHEVFEKLIHYQRRVLENL